MDSLITAAARALGAGDPLGALNRVALRDDAPALGDVRNGHERSCRLTPGDFGFASGDDLCGQGSGSGQAPRAAGRQPTGQNSYDRVE
ncbi:MAG: hypothetical protein ACREIR_15310 [Geminicoccaceae bacterium]